MERGIKQVALHESLTSSVSESTRQPSPPFGLLLAIAVFLVVETFFFLFLLLDVWSGKFAVPATLFGLPNGFVGSATFGDFMFSVSGGGLGGTTYSILAFHRHVSVRRDFTTVYAWGFFLSALVAMILGGIVFALIQGGLLVFASGAAAATSEVADMGYLGLGFLAGFGWNSVTEKLRQLINQLFGGSADRPQAAAQQSAVPPSIASNPAKGPGATENGSRQTSELSG